MNEYARIEGSSKDLKIKAILQKKQLKGEISSLLKRLDWIYSIPFFSKHEGRCWIHYDKERLKSFIKDNDDIANQPSFLQDAKIVYKPDSNKISKGYKNLNRIKLLLKKRMTAEKDIVKHLIYLQSRIDFIKFVLNQEVFKPEFLLEAKPYSRPPIKKLISYIEIEFNTFFDPEIKQKPSNFLLKNFEFYKDELSKTIDKIHLSEKTGLFLYYLLKKEHPEVKNCSSLYRILNNTKTQMIPELIFLTGFNDFKLQTARTILNLISYNTTAFNLYKRFSLYFTSCDDILMFIEEIISYNNWLNKLSFDFKEFLYGYLESIYIITPSTQVMKLVLNLVYELFNKELAIDKCESLSREATRKYILTLLLNNILFYLLNQKKNNVIQDLEIFSTSIINYCDTLFPLKYNETDKTLICQNPEFIKWYYNDLVELFLDEEAYLNDKELKQFFEYIFKLPFVSFAKAFHAYNHISKKGQQAIKNLIRLITIFKDHDDILITILSEFCYYSDFVEFIIFENLLDYSENLSPAKFRTLSKALIENRFFSKYHFKNIRKAADFIDWLATLIQRPVFKDVAEDEDVLATIVELYIKIQSFKDPLGYIKAITNDDLIKYLYILEQKDNPYVFQMIDLASKLSYCSPSHFLDYLKYSIKPFFFEDKILRFSNILESDSIKELILYTFTPDEIRNNLRAIAYSIYTLYFFKQDERISLLKEINNQIDSEFIVSPVKDPVFSRLVQNYYSQIDLIKLLIHLRQLNGKSGILPVRIIEEIFPENKLEKEYQYLLKLNSFDKNILKRIENIKNRLQKENKISESRLKNKLKRNIFYEKLSLIKNILSKKIETKFEEVFGFKLPFKFNDDYRNAILMYLDASCNKKLLKNMIKASLEDAYSWKISLEPNQAFMRKYSRYNIKWDKWLDGHSKNFLYINPKYPDVTLYIEKDPIKILQMGNYFGTCLSVGRSMAFTAVANACEINKHIVLAIDDKGRILARELIGITKDGKLGTFNIYQNCPGNFNPLFLMFLEEFSKLCNLQLMQEHYDEEGVIESILTPNWYDDGLIVLARQKIFEIELFPKYYDDYMEMLMLPGKYYCRITDKNSYNKQCCLEIPDFHLKI